MDMFSDPSVPPPAPQLDSDLLGLWLWAETLYKFMIFTDDGLVQFGFYPDEPNFAQWRVIGNNYVIIESAEIMESYTFQLTDNYLSFSSLNYSPSFVRDFRERESVGLDPALFGTWEDYYGYDFSRTFYDTGYMVENGLPWTSEWITVGDNILAMYFTWGEETWVDAWRYNITANTLELESYVQPDMVFRYSLRTGAAE
jgi:hypothetical protein